MSGAIKRLAARLSPTLRRFRIARSVLVLLAVALVAVSCGYGRALWYRHTIYSELKSPAFIDPQHRQAGRLEIHGNVPVVHVFGTAGERGTQYGTLLRKPLAALDAYVRTLLPKGQREQLLSVADELEPSLPADIREELKAVSKASGVPYRDLAAFNVIPRLRCSALAVWNSATTDKNLIMGRNADYFGMGLSDRGSLVVVHHPSEGNAVLTVNFLGMIGGFTGINSKGVAFGNMLVFNAGQQPMKKDGFAIQLQLRIAAQKADTARQMADILKTQQHIIPMNVMIADKDDAIVLEIGYSAIGERTDKDGVLASSNWFLLPDLRTEEVPCERYSALTNAAWLSYGSFTVEDMKSALFAARIKDLNLHAVIFEPRAGRIHVSINKEPASEGPYTTLVLDELMK